MQHIYLHHERKSFNSFKKHFKKFLVYLGDFKALNVLLSNLSLLFALISFLLCRWIRKYPTPTRFSCHLSSSRFCGFNCCCWSLQWYLSDSQCHSVVFITVQIILTHSLIFVHLLTTVFSAISVHPWMHCNWEVRAQFPPNASSAAHFST